MNSKGFVRKEYWYIIYTIPTYFFMCLSVAMFR